MAGFDTLAQTETEGHSSSHHPNKPKRAESEDAKTKKYAKMAYKNLKPALRKLQKFAGAVNGEKLLGMTPVGKMLKLGTPGSLERLRGNNSI
mmetsp:Transcript_28633/g.35469  ORF Transcript_28633/g.35469 Transcript_28633/m.35469 type:complete len:92 (-) Transcript_28633:271-546(-)|eukprot:CAMPEP_0170465774 /NCGR_PEP_ID=MMETSP0123-20130129/9989_1 /TAXON_ID=182087 /ORGANISM="Favella ehrenbergii, Strain Fehren 1" /LENGTH=91 /DNA_ID=CAMNT_0010731749 /DNA_START=113 /DNA_END=388 /DNA_ORIENTATION=+